MLCFFLTFFRLHFFDNCVRFFTGLDGYLTGEYDINHKKFSTKFAQKFSTVFVFSFKMNNLAKIGL